MTGAAGDFQGQSDADGNFTVTEIPAGDYTLTTTPTAYLSVQDTVTVTAGATTNIDIVTELLGSLSGTVTDSNTSSGVSGIVVWAVGENGEMVTTVTASDGTWLLDDLYAGTWQVRVGDQALPSSVGTDVVVNAANNSANLDFQLDVSGTISGTVFEDDGTTVIEDAYVALILNDEVVHAALTDENGHYSFVLLADGTYNVEALSLDYAFDTIAGLVADGATDLSGQDFVGGDTSISGVITDADTNAPVEGAVVAVAYTGPLHQLEVITEVVTDASGAWSFSGAVPGDYRVTATAPGYAFDGAAVMITGATQDIDLALPIGFSLTGSVVNESGVPLRGATVQIVSETMPVASAVARVPEDGTFDFANLPADTYTLIVSAQGKETVVRSGVIVGPNVAAQNIALQPSTTRVTGTVFVDGVPVGNVVIAAVNQADQLIAHVLTDADGSYSITSLPAGSYELLASTSNGPTSSTAIVLADGQSLTGVDMTSTVVAILDPVSAAASSNLGTFDYLARTLKIVKRRGDHPTRSSLTPLFFQLPDACTPAARATLDSLNRADTKFKQWQEIADGVHLTDAATAFTTLLLNSTIVVGATARLGLIGTLAVHAAVGSTAVTIGGVAVTSISAWVTAMSTVDLLNGLYQTYVNGIKGVSTPAGVAGLANDTATIAVVVKTAKVELKTLSDLLNAAKLEAVAGGAAFAKIASVLGVIDAVLDAFNAWEAAKQDASDFLNTYTAWNNAASQYDKSVDKVLASVAHLQACRDRLMPPGPGPGGPNGTSTGSPGRTNGGNAMSSIPRSFDPNDKIGPSGVGSSGFVQAGLFPYEIQFENDPDLGATIPAQEVFVTDTLDDDLDLTTFEFTNFGFNNMQFDVPQGLSHYEVTLDLRKENIDLLVEVTLDVDTKTRVLSASFRSLDPLTQKLPDDVDAGFLPVNDKAVHNGEGFLTYSVETVGGLTTGTEITNQAEIVFDVNAPILTPAALNTIDAGRRPVALPRYRKHSERLAS